MKKMEKTNVMRILDQMNITYREHTYDSTEAISGTENVVIAPRKTL